MEMPANRRSTCDYAKEKIKTAYIAVSRFHSEAGVPNRIRTGVTAVKGQCPRPLDDGDSHVLLQCFYYKKTHQQIQLQPLCQAVKQEFCGGGKRDRTDDLLHAMQALSQLSYTPTWKSTIIAGAGGFCKATARLNLPRRQLPGHAFSRARTSSRPSTSMIASMAGVCV